MSTTTYPPCHKEFERPQIANVNHRPLPRRITYNGHIVSRTTELVSRTTELVLLEANSLTVPLDWVQC